jgi:hypothetical protein
VHKVLLKEPKVLREDKEHRVYKGLKERLKGLKEPKVGKELKVIKEPKVLQQVLKVI